MSSTLIDEVRSGNKEAKKKLPVVLFSGEFSSRKDEALFEHSGLVVLDFDHVDVDKTKQALATDDFVLACWTSPSGDGIKAVVKITNPERHRDHFRSLIAYFDKQYGLQVDETGINESRACFESYDPDIVIKDDVKKFGAFLTEQALQQTPINDEYEYTDYMKLNLAARMIRNAEDGEKHMALIKAATLCGGYIAAGKMEEEEVVRVLFREICKRDIDSESQAQATIRDGIEKGKTMPIREVIDNAQGLIELGLDTGDELLDQHFRYKKEFVIINGHSNVGKTTTALYLMVNASIRHGWKWIVYSSENRTASIKMSLMQFACNKKAGNMTYAERKQAYKWVQKHFTVISNKQVYSYADIILFMEKVMRQQDVDAIFVDPYNSLKLDMRNSSIGVHDYHYEAASEFLTFSTSHNVAVWLNMHAVTEAQRRKDAEGMPIAPYAEDTEGGGKFVNRADCFLTIHRKVQHQDPAVRCMSELHVRKVRNTETGGEPTGLEDPFRFIMDISRTGFKTMTTHKSLFQPIGLQEATQGRLNIGMNVDFLNSGN